MHLRSHSRSIIVTRKPIVSSVMRAICYSHRCPSPSTLLSTLTSPVTLTSTRHTPLHPHLPHRPHLHHSPPSSITSQLVELFSVGCSDLEAAQELRALVGPTVAWASSSRGQVGRGDAPNAPPTSTYGNSSSTYSSSGTRSSYCPSVRDGAKDTSRVTSSQDDAAELSLGEGSASVTVEQINVLLDCTSYDDGYIQDSSISVILSAM